MEEQNNMTVEKFDEAEIRMSGRGVRAVVENIDAFFSVDPTTEEGSAESIQRIEAIMFMFDDILTGCGLSSNLEEDQEARLENEFYTPVVIG